MRNHWQGLRLNEFAVIDTQTHAGNRWLPPANYGSMFGAVNMNASSPFTLAQSLFIINTLPGTIYNPSIPPFDAGWFLLDLFGSPYNCPATLPCFDPSFIVNGGSEILRTYIALDSSLSSSLINETKSIAKMQLYDELKANPSAYSGNAAIMQFKNKNDTSAIGKLYIVKNKIKSIAEFDSLSLILINQLDSMMSLKVSVIRTLDSMATVNPSNNYSAQRDSLINQVNVLIHTRNNLIAVHDSTAGVKISEGLALNLTITSANLPEQNQKAMNEVAAKYYLHGKDSILSYFPQILSVAVQCPYAGGTAVYQAQSFSKLLNDTIAFDVAICAQALREAAVEQNEGDYVLIIPNPASEQINVSFKETLAGICHIKACDMLGNEVIRKTLDCKIKSHTFSVKNLVQGVYQVSVTVNNREIKHSKLMIIR